MKNKLGILVLLVLGVLSARGQGASTCPFVYMEDDRFMYQGEPFVVKAIEYNMEFHAEISGGDTIIFYGPDKFYVNNYPTNQDAINDLMHAHIKLISDMGFNTLRITNWVNYVNFNYQSVNYAGLYFNLWDRYDYDLTGSSGDGDKNSWIDVISFDENKNIFFEAMDTLFAIANSYGLKVIWNCGAGKLEKCMPEYLDYLDTISKHYCHNTALFAYDFWAEPKEFSIPSIANNSYLLKQRIAEMTDSMNVQIKTNDRNHFTSIGTDNLLAEYDFGFKSLYCDFVNPHIYDTKYFFFGLPDYATENILFRDIYWFKNYITDRKWMIGETGLPGGQGTELNTPGVYADYAEQKRVTDTVLNFATACSEIGIAWWQFHDVSWAEQKGVGYWDSYLGLVSSTGSTQISGLHTNPSSLNIYGTVKDAGNTTTGSFKTFTIATANCYLDDEEYFNPNNLDTSSVYTGYVYRIDQGDTVPMEGAIVTVYKIKHGLYLTDLMCADDSCSHMIPTPRDVRFTGITDENGRYEVHTAYDSIKAYMIKSSAYGMTVYTYWDPVVLFDDDIPADQEKIHYLQEIPLQAQTTFANDITVSANTTWADGDDRWLSGNLTVASGATLTIYCDVYFLEGKGITINQGGRINLFGKLSSAGTDYLWNGINILGNSNANQEYSHQGVFATFAGSCIENAIYGVKVQSGGVCRVSNCRFENNRYSVFFYPYSYVSDNCSYVTVSHFITSRWLNDGSLPKYQVYMNGVKIIDITYSTFENTLGVGYYADERGIGIKSYNAIYKLKSTTFNRLYYAVYSAGGTPRIVQGNEFNKNYRGVFIGNSTNAEFTENTINGCYDFLPPENEQIPEPSYYSASQYSVYVAGNGTNSTLAKFEDNSFYGGTVGSVFYNTGPTALIAKNNSYDSIAGLPNACAAIAIGKNSNFVAGHQTLIGNIGLQLRCNDFSRNPYAISIVDGNLRKYQGEYNAGSGSDYAGNAFDHYGSNSERDFYLDQVIASSLDISEYIYYSHTDSLHNIEYYSNKITEDGLVDWYEESDCSAQGGGIIMGISVEEGSQLIEQTDTEIILKEAELEDVVDNGNTCLLLSNAETMNTGNSVAVASEIALLDGFISDEVAITFMQNNNCNPFAKANALLENSPLPLAVRGEIDDMEMNPTLKQIVKNQQDGVNNRDAKNMEIADLKQYRSLLITEIVVAACENDSLPEEKQALKQFLNNDDDIQSKFQLFNIYMKEGDFDNARFTLKKIHQMNPENSVEFDNFMSLMEITINIDSGLINLEDAVEQNSNLLEEIASEETNPGQITAQLLLAEAGVESYFEVIRLPEPVVENKSLKLSPDENPINSTSLGDIINIYPNPSSGTLYIEYAFLNFDNRKRIEIFTMSGVLIESIHVNQAVGVCFYNKQLVPGNYIVKIGENYSEVITIQ